MPITAADLPGGCLCGTVRFRLTAEPDKAGWCHCRTCQLNSGSPAMAFANVPVGNYLIERGADAIRRFASSDHAKRWFCGECGTPLLFAEDGAAEYAFSIATLDLPVTVTPENHIYYASRIPWAEAADDLPKFDRLDEE